MTIEQELELLRSTVPSPDTATAERIHRLATTARSSWPRRLRTTGALAAAALAIAGGSVAAIREVPWWQNGTPPVDPQSVASVARDNMPATVDTAKARTVAQDGSAALVAVPLDETGYCLIPSLDGRASLGTQCEYQVRHAQQGDDDRTVSMRRDDAWIVYGRITDPRAATIDLGVLSLGLKPGGFFIASVPKDRWAALEGTANAGRILDRSGATLREGCVDWSGASLWRDGSTNCKPEPTPTIPTLDLAHATKLFEITLMQPYSIWKAGTTIEFVEAQSSDGSICSTSTGPGLATRLGNGGACRRPGTWSSPQPLNVTFSAQRAHDGERAFYIWAITGAADPGAHVAKLELRSPSGAIPVLLADNFFFAQIAQTSASTDAFPAGPYTLDAYDASGAKVASIDLNELHGRLRPR
ncbi:MAG: hypothetical protein ACJ76I_00765 [Gaiellaceae bacterium]